MSPKDPFRYQVVIARLISPRCRDRCPGDRLRAVTGYPCGLSRLLVVRWNGNDLIHWTANTGPTAIQDVAVNHGCRDILVPKQFLDRTYVVAIFQKWVANEWRNVWQLTGLLIPARRTASLTARWSTDSSRWWRRRSGPYKCELRERSIASPALVPRSDTSATKL